MRLVRGRDLALSEFELLRLMARWCAGRPDANLAEWALQLDFGSFTPEQVGRTRGGRFGGYETHRGRGAKGKGEVERAQKGVRTSGGVLERRVLETQGCARRGALHHHCRLKWRTLKPLKASIQFRGEHH
jgi:hypothetical protein